jgi:hypothetical protein
MKTTDKEISALAKRLNARFAKEGAAWDDSEHLARGREVIEQENLPADVEWMLTPGMLAPPTVALFRHHAGKRHV